MPETQYETERRRKASLAVAHYLRDAPPADVLGVLSMLGLDRPQKKYITGIPSHPGDIGNQSGRDAWGV